MSVDNSNVLVPDERIMSKIYLIRDQKVMLNRDLANLFSVKAIRLREQVKRNPDKFPEHFMFQLTENEVEIDGIAKCDTIEKTSWRCIAFQQTGKQTAS